MLGVPIQVGCLDCIGSHVVNCYAACVLRSEREPHFDVLFFGTWILFFRFCEDNKSKRAGNCA